MALDRRRFLQLSALGLFATVAETGCSPRRDRPLDQPLLIATLGAERVRALGSRYRSQTPAENSVDALRAAIEKGRGSRTLGRSLDDTIEDDFANGRVAIVDGWVLSLTEARQAALFSLSRA
jgi:hypothetical protein